MDIKQKVSIHNRFDIEVIDARTGKVKQTAKAENIILNNLWATLLNSNEARYFGYIFYGSGTGTPSASDTQLFNHVGAVEVNGSDGTGMVGYTYTCDNKTGIASARGMIQLDENTSVGVIITEVGIGCGTSATDLCTHAMLEDMNGNPISITKTDTDIINIYATVYAHWTQIGAFYFDHVYIYDSSTSRQLPCLRGWVLGTGKGRHYGFTHLAPGEVRLGKEGADWYMGYNNNRQNYAVYKDATVTFDTSLKKAIFSVPRYAVGEANMGGIGSLWLSGNGDTQAVRLHVSDFYAGDNIVGEAVGTGDGTTTRFACKFDYPEQAKVYVNGVQQSSGVTVRKIPCNTLDLKQAYVRKLYSNSTDANNLLLNNGEFNNTGWFDRSRYVLAPGEIIRNMINDVGFASLYPAYYSEPYRTKILGSNDLTTWAEVYNGSDTATAQSPFALDSTTGHYKYYKAVGIDSNSQPIYLNWASEDFKAIVFDTAPQNGDVITIDYHTPYIAKDADHVLDLTYTIQFGEHVE